MPGPVTTTYQTRQALALTIGCAALHENAFWNSGMFSTVPLTRKHPGACASVIARFLASCGAIFSHQTCAKPRNRRCSGREAVGLFALAPQRFLQRHVGDPHTAVVRRVLAQGEPAVGGSPATPELAVMDC